MRNININYCKIIVLLCLISSIGRFVLDSYLPSLPAIGGDFGISSESVQMTLTTYLLGFSISQLIYGPLSDHYGRRNVILVGLSIFVLGNLICAIAVSSSLLLVARFIAGTGAGACGVLNRAIASDCFKGAEFSKAWSYTTSALVITLCIAPVIGGYIQEQSGWRANFILSTAYVAIVLCLILKFLPETNKQKVNLNLMHPSIKLSKILLDYYQILTTRSFITGTLCYTLAFSGLIAYFQVSPSLFIDGLGLSPSQYGWCSVIIASNYLIGGMLVHKLALRMSTYRLLIIGTMLLIFGGLLMLITYFFDYAGLTAILLPTSVYVIGARIVIPNAIAHSLEELRHISGSCSAMIGCIQMLGSAFISFLIANFDTMSPLTLAIFFTILGCATLSISMQHKSCTPLSSVG